MALSIAYGGYHLPSAIDRLRAQRKPETKPRKPKPVTDEQLLAVVTELEAEVKDLREELRYYKARTQEKFDAFGANGAFVRLFSLLPFRKGGEP